MASPDFPTSLIHSSDEYPMKFCDPCFVNNLRNEASNHCEECREYLCQNCTVAHSGQKLSRHHNIMLLEEQNRRTIPTKANAYKPKCGCNQNLEISHYCQVHNDVTCRTCCTMKHRKCEMKPIECKSASYSTAQFIAVEKKVKNLIYEFDKFFNKRSEDLKTLAESKKEAINNLKQFRNDINQNLDLLERKLLREIDEKESKEKDKIQCHIESCTTSMQILQKDSKLLEEAKQNATVTDMFVIDMQISKGLDECDELLRDIRKEANSKVALAFVRNEVLSDILDQLNSLGRLIGDNTCSNSVEEMRLPEKRVDNTSSVPVRYPLESSPRITGCAFMNGGQVVLCDYNNNKVKLLSNAFKKQNDISLPTYPWDVAAVDDKRTIVTLPDKAQLLYLEVVPKLKQGRILQLDLDKNCYGIDVVKDEIYVTCYRGGPWEANGEVNVLDLNGKVKKRLGVYSLLACPYNLAVNIETNSVYVTDEDSFTVTCLSTDGNIVYRYMDNELRWPRGICCSDGNSVFVCGKESDNIHIVNAQGKKQSVLLTSKDGVRRPLCLAYRKSDDILIIGCEDMDELFICKLKSI